MRTDQLYQVPSSSAVLSLCAVFWIQSVSPAQAQSACNQLGRSKESAGAWNEAIHALNYGLDTEVAA
jgi:hypothetical protein